MNTTTKMLLERISSLPITLVMVSALVAPRSVLADVEYDFTIPQLKFADTLSGLE